MKTRIPLLLFAAAAIAVNVVLAGPDPLGEPGRRSLYSKMYWGMLCHASCRDETSPDPIDEMNVKSEKAGGYETRRNLPAASERPVMEYAPEKGTPGEEDFWPFDVAEWERGIGGRLEREETGVYQLVLEDGSLARELPGLGYGFKALRFVSEEMTRWAVAQLDGKYDRVGREMATNLVSESEVGSWKGKDILENKGECAARPAFVRGWVAAWDVGVHEGMRLYLTLQQIRNGFINPSVFSFVVAGEAGRPHRIASFRGFPSRENVLSVLRSARKGNPAADNNMAALMWNHENFVHEFDSKREEEVRSQLVAASNSVPEAARNLARLDDYRQRVAELNRNVYEIEDPTNRLAAIRAKWPHAGDRVSQWKMPDFEERFEYIDSFQNWCNEDKANRYGQFENACREAIALKIEPAIWFYNLACALAVQGNPEKEVFDALEQAVAAGYNEQDHAMADEDFQSVTNDMRFAKLCESMFAIDWPWSFPKRMLNLDDKDVILSEDVVSYVFNEHSYFCMALTTNQCPIVYLNHHENHGIVPCGGLIVPKFSDAAIEAGRASGHANMRFRDFFLSQMKVYPEDFTPYVPTIVAADFELDDDRLNRPMSIPASFSLKGAWLESSLHNNWNVLGVYPAGSDYGVDGIDRFFGNAPLCVTYEGGAEEADKFVRLIRDIIRAMPGYYTVASPPYVMNIIRHAQKCVKDEGDFMNGIAHRPVLRFSDLDEDRARSVARDMKERRPPFPPCIKSRQFDPDTPCVDLVRFPLDNHRLTDSMFHTAFVATSAEKTFGVRVEVDADRGDEIVWKVLQGCEDKIRLLPQTEDRTSMRIEVDHHDVFVVDLPGGGKVKSSRVDIGCFCVRDGIASIPTMISVYFSPNETREYDADGRLASIDYTKPQLEEFYPALFPRGDWKDVFHWDSDGRLSGWTRHGPDIYGKWTTNEFSRDGMMIDSRDELGRPKDVHFSLRATLAQEDGPSALQGEGCIDKLAKIVLRHIEKNVSLLDSTIAFQYEYKSDADRVGVCSRKPPAPFRHRPELSMWADFSDESGFALPLADQMRFGYHRRIGYCRDNLMWWDSAHARSGEGSGVGGKAGKPPKRMSFCPWRPGTNDLWRIDMDDYEEECLASLMELGDGAYRLSGPGADGKDGYLSIHASYREVNSDAEGVAYGKLDEAFPRCGAAEVKERLSSFIGEDGWKSIAISEEDPLLYEDLPEDVYRTLALWRISGDVHFGVRARFEGLFASREYFFYRGKAAEDDVGRIVFFHELPSKAIGNAVLGAMGGNADALNNLAVLLYAGVANPDAFDEKRVVRLLRRSAKLGNATAKHNLAILGGAE